MVVKYKLAGENLRMAERFAGKAKLKFLEQPYL